MLYHLNNGNLDKAAAACGASPIAPDCEATDRELADKHPQAPLVACPTLPDGAFTLETCPETFDAVFGRPPSGRASNVSLVAFEHLKMVHRYGGRDTLLTLATAINAGNIHATMAAWRGKYGATHLYPADGLCGDLWPQYGRATGHPGAVGTYTDGLHGNL